VPLVKKLVAVGNSQGVVLDKSILQMVNLAPNDEVEISVEDSRIVITPHRYMGEDKFRAAADRAFAKHGKALKRLAR
jgi:antitoxin component of MazEF toxin-antitoxin module